MVIASVEGGWSAEPRSARNLQGRRFRFDSGVCPEHERNGDLDGVSECGGSSPATIQTPRLASMTDASAAGSNPVEAVEPACGIGRWTRPLRVFVAEVVEQVIVTRASGRESRRRSDPRRACDRVFGPETSSSCWRKSGRFSGGALHASRY